VGNSDREHFSEYTPQNRIKHAILGKYFSAYLNALGRFAEAFHYIDGFAGAGTYEDQHHGSPLIALTLLSNQPRPASASFIEKDTELFSRLRQAVNGHPPAKKLLDVPLIEPGAFSDWVGTILARPIYTWYNKVATFAFVDPCGVSGLRMQDLAAVLSRPYGECLVFWNYDGINRWLGGVRKGEHSRAGLVDLFGSDVLVDQALSLFDGTRTDKETGILELFIRALNDAGTTHILPFRVVAKGRNRTSHYLLHCSSHGLAFKIMKEVMASTTTADDGEFEFSTALESGSLFSPVLDGARREVLSALASGPAAVRVFTEQWVMRPRDYLREKDYRELLLSLEQEGKIEVLDKNAANVAPATKRPKRLGKPTLGPDYIVRLRGST
jgi:three-Cys-motif partner protein